MKTYEVQVRNEETGFWSVWKSIVDQENELANRVLAVKSAKVLYSQTPALGSRPDVRVVEIAPVMKIKVLTDTKEIWRNGGWLEDRVEERAAK